MWLWPAARSRKSGYASVEMTKGRAELFLKTGCREELQIAPLRSCGAPAGMTRGRVVAYLESCDSDVWSSGGRAGLSPPCDAC
jgi:hypothetical protein